MALTDEKAAAVNQTAAQKQAQISGGFTEIAQFDQAFPNASVGDRFRAEADIAYRRSQGIAPRDIGQVAGDIGSDLSQVAVNATAGVATGLGVALTADQQGLRDNAATALREGYNNYNRQQPQADFSYGTVDPNAPEAERVAPTQAAFLGDLNKSALDAAVSVTEFNQDTQESLESPQRKRQRSQYDNAKAALEASPEYQGATEFNKELLKADFVAKAIIDYPLVSESVIVQGIGDLASSVVTGGVAAAVGKRSAQKAAAKAGQEAADKVTETTAKVAGTTQVKQDTKALAEKARKDAVDAVDVNEGAAKTAGAAATIQGALQEGSSNANQVATEIRGMSHEELSDSEEYTAAYEAAEGTEEEKYEQARDEIASRAASNTFVGTGLTAAAIGRLTGADQAAGDIATSALRGGARRARAVAGEGIEESVQSGSGQVISNVASRLADPDRSAYEGVAEASIQGALGGVGASGAVQAPSIAKSAIDKVKAIKTTKTATQEAEAATVAQEAVVPNSLASSNYGSAANTAVDSISALATEEGNTPEAQQQAAQDIVATFQAYQEVVATGTPEQQEAAKALRENPESFLRQANQVLQTTTAERGKLAEVLGKGTATPEDIAQLAPIASKVLYSSTFSNSGVNVSGQVNLQERDVLEQVLATEEYTRNVPEGVLLAARAKLEQLDNVAGLVNALSDVSAEIAAGLGEGTVFVGVETRIQDGTDALNRGDIAGAQEQVDAFNSFREGHKAKAVAARQLLNERIVSGTNNQVPLVSTLPDGTVVEHNQLAPTKDGYLLPIGDSMVIHRGSGRLVRQLEKEVEYLDAVAPFVEGITNPQTLVETEQQTTGEVTPDTNTINDVPVTQMSDEALQEVADNGDVESEDTNAAQQELADREQEQLNADQLPEGVAPVESQEVTQEQTDLEDTTDTAPEGTVEEVAPTTESEQETVAADTATLDTFAVATVLSDVNNAVLSDESFGKAEGEVADVQKSNAVVDNYQTNSNSPMGTTRNLVGILANAGLEQAKAIMEKFTPSKRMNSADMYSLKKYQAFRTRFNEVAQKRFKKQYKYYVQGGNLTAVTRQKSPMLYLANDQGELPESVLDALSMASWNWMMYESGDAEYNLASDNHRILGGDGKTDAFSKELSEAGTVQQNVLDYLGQNTFDMIGLQATSDTPLELHDALVADLGSTALFLLNSEAQGINLVQKTSMDADVFRGLQELYGIPEAKRYKGSAARNFIKLNDRIPSLKETVRPKVSSESSRITEKLGNARANNESLFIGSPPPKVEQLRIKGSDRLAAPKAVEAHNKANRRKYFVNKNMQNVLFGTNGLGDDFIRSMLGYSEVGTGYAQADLAREGLNQTIDTDLNNAKGFLTQYAEHAEGTPVFFDHDFVSTTRHQMKGAFNPQSAKLHRFMLGVGTDTINLGNTSALNRFYLAVGQGLDVKVDKQSNRKSVKQIKVKLQEPMFVDAITELKKGIQGQEMNADLILPAVLAGGEKTGSLKALVAAAELELAQESGADTFDTDIMFEIDGVTNGPFHALLQLSANVRDGLKRAGLYKSAKRVSHNLKAATSDNYIATADVASEWMHRNFENLSKGQQQAVLLFSRFSGSSIEIEDGKIVIKRNLGKGPTTKVTYGAGTLSNTTALFHHALEGFNEEMDKHLKLYKATNDRSHLQEAVSLIDTWSNLVTVSYPDQFGNEVRGMNKPSADRMARIESSDSVEQVYEKLRNFKFSNTHKNHMIGVYGSTFGTAIEEGISSTLGNVQMHGKEMVLMTSLMHRLHVDAFETGVAAAKKATKSPLGITRGEFANEVGKVKGIAPSFRPYFAGEGKRNNYVQLSDRTTISGNDIGKSAFSEQALYGKEYTFDEPGVKGLPLATISIDGSNSMMLNTIGDIPHLNVYDGFYVSPNNIGKMTKLLNTSDYTVNQGFDMYSEFVNQLENVLKNHPVLRDTSVTASAKQKYIESLLTPQEFRSLEDLGFAVGTEFNKHGKATAWELTPDADFAHNVVQYFRKIGNGLADAKAEALKDSSYNQFVGTEGSQILTDSEGNIKNGTNALKEWNASHNTTARKEAESSRDIMADNAAYYEEGKVVSGKEGLTELLDEALGNIKGGDTSVNKTRKVIAESLKKTLSDDISVSFVDFANTEYKDNAFGVRDGNNVFINSSPLVQMNQNKVAETIVHELIHASTADIIQRVMGNNLDGLTQAQVNAVHQLDAQAMRLYKDLKASPELRKQYGGLAKYFSQYDQKSSEGRTVALAEFMAYGLSDQGVAYQLTQRPTSLSKRLMKQVYNWAMKMIGARIRESELTDLMGRYYEITSSATTPKGTPVVFYSDSYDKGARTIFDKLQGDGTEHDAYLEQALIDVETQLTAQLSAAFPTGVNAEQASDQVFLDQFDPDVRTTANRMVGSGFKMSPKESLVYQMYAETLRSAFADGFENRDDTRKLFNIAKKNLAPSDFTTGTTDDAKALGKAKYDALFNSTDSANDYLANFAAMSKTNLELRTALEGVSTSQVSSTYPSGLINAISHGISHAYEAMTRTLISGGRGDALSKLDKVSRNITHIKATRGSLVDGGLDTAEAIGSQANAWIEAAATKSARGVRSFSKTPLANVIANTFEAFQKSDDGRKAIQAGLKDMVARNSNSSLNAAQELVEEVTGVVEESEPLHAIRRISQYQVQANRERTKTAIKDNILASFDNITEAEEAEVTKMLYADMSSLIVNGYSPQRITELLSDPVAMQSEIDQKIALIKIQPVGNTTKNFYINSAIGLGKHMATGLTYSQFQLQNAAAIANGVGTDFVTLDNTAEPLIDTLASLVALQEMDTDVLNSVMKRELARTGVNGVNYTLRKHNQIKRKQAERFGDKYKLSSRKGYTFDTTDPNKSITTGKPGDKHLLNRGYTETHTRFDNGEVMYTSDFAGNIPHVSGAMSTIQSLFDGIDPKSGRVGAKKLPAYTGAKAHKVHTGRAAAITRLGKPDQINRPYNTAIPTVGLDGNINGYHYELSHAEKDNLLNRNSRISEVLGGWEGRIEEELASTKYNSELVDALLNRYETSTNKGKFIAVSARHSDKRIRDLWHLMPSEMQNEVKAKFGGSTLYIHRSELNNALGYRQLSVLDLWTKEDRGRAAQIATDMMEGVGINAKRARNIERFVQELVSEIKDIIVVKSIVVSVANIVSNIMQMHLRGVPWKAMAKDSKIAIKAVTQFRSNQAELLRLQDQLESGQDVDRARIAELEQDLDNSPIKDLVDAGLLPAIVDDISEQDEYSLKHGLLAKFGEGADRLGIGKLESDSVIKNALITRDSKTYEFLSSSVELGDFAAKYTVYQHYLGQGESKESALNKVGVEFIDYGALSSRELDYLNKTGMANFFKYYLRIHPIISNLITTQPARILGLLTTQGVTGVDIVTPLDSIGADLGAKTGLFDLISGVLTHPVTSPL